MITPTVRHEVETVDLKRRRSPSRTPSRRPQLVAPTAAVEPRTPSRRRRPLDAESLSWWARLHAIEPTRSWAIAELYERLRREAAFHIRHRVASMSEFPRSDIDDLATEAAGDALVVLLRKLEDYRGDSRFWTWARRFAALEAPVSIRRRLGHDRVGISRDPDGACDAADRGPSAHDRLELRELLHQVSEIMIHELTARQRTVLTAVAINGVSATALAEELQTTPGAVHKSLHDARTKVRRLALEPQRAEPSKARRAIAHPQREGRVLDSVPQHGAVAHASR